MVQEIILEFANLTKHNFAYYLFRELSMPKLGEKISVWTWMDSLIRRRQLGNIYIHTNIYTILNVFDISEKDGKSM